jgi:signal transduction histidine kinase
MDKSRLHVILSNLLANAIKYHDLRKEHRWISIDVSNSGDTVKLKISDNGTGIQPEHQERIFEMFYRGTVLSSGSGLGLYIVKQAVEKMEGTITVQSVAGEGSSFLVVLPVSGQDIV